MEALIKQLAKEYFSRLNVEDEKCISFEEDDGASTYTGTHSSAISWKITFKRDNQSELVFIKYFTDSEQSYDFNIRPSFENELLFYQKICPFLQSVRSIEHLVPHFLAGKVESKSDGDTIAVMMRRLAPEWVCHHLKSLDYKHMSMMMRKLGEFHAYSFAAKQRDSKKFAELSTLTTNVVVSLQIPAYWAKLVPILQRGLQPLRANPKYREGVARVDQLLHDFSNQATKSFLAQPGAKFSVLGHLSYNQSNVLFRYNNGIPTDMKIMDWQTVSISPLGADFMRTLYSSTGQQIWNLHFDRLVDDYHVALSSTFKNCDIPSRADIVEELKHSVCAALFVLSHRVLAMNKSGSDGCKICKPHPVWNDELVTSMFEQLIGRGLL